MLQEERFSKILEILELDGSVTVATLMEKLQSSESTIRRDLVAMDKAELLTRVHGGAVLRSTKYNTIDQEVSTRQTINIDEKKIIGKYAASLIQEGDFVYVDAGTTTQYMLEYIKEKNVTFVTNAIGHAKILSAMGLKTYILGGEFKSSTEAIVGEEAVVTLDKYNFTKGFWGTNGVNQKNGFTTPEVKEAMVKKKAMENCKERFVLADLSKFSEISSVKFAEYEDAMIITTGDIPNAYMKTENLLIVE